MFAEYCEDLAYEIAFWMQGFDEPSYPMDELGRLTRDLSDNLRSLAIMVLLSKGKVDRFHHNLIRSGRVRCVLKLPRFGGHPFTWESPHAETTPVRTRLNSAAA